MTLFGFHPDAVMARAQADARPVRIPSFKQSLLTSTAGFTLASLAVYSSWAFQCRMLYTRLGEGGAYAVWAAMFILLAGGLLNPVVIGPRSLRRFYALFAVAFTAYAFCWSASYFILRGRAGEWAGSLLGTAALGFVLARGFGFRGKLWKVLVALFVLHSAGYFLGSALHDFFRGADEQHWLNQFMDRPTRRLVSMLSWGFAHGLGLGAGLGFALHECQSGIRDLLNANAAPPEGQPQG
jgi:hypothetical protein